MAFIYFLSSFALIIFLQWIWPYSYNALHPAELAFMFAVLLMISKLFYYCTTLLTMICHFNGMPQESIQAIIAGDMNYLKKKAEEERIALDKYHRECEERQNANKRKTI